MIDVHVFGKEMFGASEEELFVLRTGDENEVGRAGKNGEIFISFWGDMMHGKG